MVDLIAVLRRDSPSAAECYCCRLQPYRAPHSGLPLYP
jgi:hypothetical protein